MTRLELGRSVAAPTRALAFSACLLGSLLSWAPNLQAEQPAEPTPPPALTDAGNDGEAIAAPSSSLSQEILFQQGVEALTKGAFDQAIVRFELLADRGVVHPDLSFNRGLAYAQRALSTQTSAGDLGRAAASFHEVLHLRSGDKQAAEALHQIEAQITRRRAQEGREPVIVHDSLSRALVGLASEWVWSALALLASIILSCALALRLWSKRQRLRFSAGVAAAVAGLSLLVFGGLAASARHFRANYSPAVVIATEARLLSEGGKPLPKSGELEFTAIPEGAQVWVHENRDGLALVEWGNTSAWVAARELQLLAR